MHGKTSTARQASAGGHARHAGTAPAEGPFGYGSSRVSQPGTGMRVPPFAARQANSPAGGWAHHSFLELGALPGAVPSARLHARQVLLEWGLAVLADSIELLVSGN